MVQMQAKMDLMQEQLSAALRNQNPRPSPEENQRVLVSPEENQNVRVPLSAGGAVEPEVVLPDDAPAPGGTAPAPGGISRAAAPEKPSPPPGEVSDARRTPSEDAEGRMRDGVGVGGAGSLAEVVAGGAGAEARHTTEEDAERGSLRMGGRFRTKFQGGDTRAHRLEETRSRWRAGS
jgi:hypothetical protein